MVELDVHLQTGALATSGQTFSMPSELKLSYLY